VPVVEEPTVDTQPTSSAGTGQPTAQDTGDTPEGEVADTEPASETTEEEA
jgi:hypothetical protein